jgi:ABC-type lipoprotein release transport system permease subunit
MDLKLAWRNIWRNKRRTLITLASVFLAVVLSTLMMSMKGGIYNRMISSSVESYTGYVQIHAQGYWEDKNMDESLVVNAYLAETINQVEGITAFVPRIESFALTASDSATRGAMVVGIETELEKQYTQMQNRVSDGEYLEANDKAVLIGSGLSESLKLKVGDTIVLLGMGYQGQNAAGKYPIKGIVKYGSPELSKQLVILPLKEAQWFYGAPNRCTNLVVLMESSNQAKRIRAELKSLLPQDEYEVMHWEELSPDLKNIIETDKVEGYVFMFILYLVISFGIFGTMLMMLAERMREFGVLIAVGMKRIRLAFMVWLEVVMISLLGAVFGMMGAFPVCGYFYWNPITFGEDMGKMFEEYGMEPILQTSLDPMIFLQQGVIVALIATLIATYPFIRILGLSAIKAMRS